MTGLDADQAHCQRSRVLFVDDEQNVLDGLQRGLRSYRKQWEMTFLTSPRAALEHVKEQAVDVVVSDMRMPEMTGSELLEEIRRVRPDTIRFILSGHSEVSTIMKSVGPSHQFLSKPCSPEQLLARIQSACALREHLNDPSLCRVVGSIESLPSLPTIYTDLRRALDAEADLPEIAQIISTDIAMTAKVLQLVNSSYFGLARCIEDPVTAVQLLGTETIQSIVLTASVFRALNPPDAELIESVYRRSVQAGAFARRICLDEKVDDVFLNQALVGTFLHEIGLLILATKRPDLYRVCADGASAWTSEDEERELVGTAHGQMGGYLLGLWALPDSVVEAVTYHHGPENCLSQGFAPLSVVHVAQAMAHAGLTADTRIDDLSAHGLAEDYLSRLDLIEPLQGWLRRCAELVP